MSKVVKALDALKALSRYELDEVGTKLAMTPLGIEIVSRLKRQQDRAPIGEADAWRLQAQRGKRS